jgi:hypothetical protein
MLHEASPVDHRASSLLIGFCPPRSGAALRLPPSAADIFSGDILASLTCRSLGLGLTENFDESGEKHFPFFPEEQLYRDLGRTSSPTAKRVIESSGRIAGDALTKGKSSGAPISAPTFRSLSVERPAIAQDGASSPR